MSRSSLLPRARRLSHLVIAGLLTVGIAACSTGSGGEKLSATDPIPDEVPEGTSLSIGVKTARLQSQVTDLFDELSFTVSDWPDVQGGPDVIQAFRGNALDLATNAAIPPIQAEATGLDARIVAVREKAIASYQIATAPGSNIEKLSDLRGKKIALSPGQAQGVVVLRTLAAEGIGLDEVEFIELPGPQFLTALQAKQVDAAVLSEPAITKYLDQYGSEGARGIPTDALDLLSVLWAPVSVLEDPAKAAAIKEFIPLWAKADVWTWENKEEWAQKYYVDSEGVSPEDAKRIIETVAQRPNFPESWDNAIAWTQETIELLAESGYFEHFDANKIFDRRFEGVASDAVPAEYRTGVQG